jgi:hypothetical protein
VSGGPPLQPVGRPHASFTRGEPAFRAGRYQRIDYLLAKEADRCAVNRNLMRERRLFQAQGADDKEEEEVAGEGLP